MSQQIDVEHNVRVRQALAIPKEYLETALEHIKEGTTSNALREAHEAYTTAGVDVFPNQVLTNLLDYMDAIKYLSITLHTGQSAQISLIPDTMAVKYTNSEKLSLRITGIAYVKVGDVRVRSRVDQVVYPATCTNMAKLINFVISSAYPQEKRSSWDSSKSSFLDPDIFQDTEKIDNVLQLEVQTLIRLDALFQDTLPVSFAQQVAKKYKIKDIVPVAIINSLRPVSEDINLVNYEDASGMILGGGILVLEEITGGDYRRVSKTSPIFKRYEVFRQLT